LEDVLLDVSAGYQRGVSGSLDHIRHGDLYAAFHHRRIFNSSGGAYGYIRPPMVQLLTFIIDIPFKDASCYTDWLVTVPLVLIVFSLARAAFSRTAFCMKLTHGLDLGSFPLLLHGLARGRSGMVTFIAAVHYICGLVMRLKLEGAKMASTWFL
jgi:hypothetical protein